MSEGHTRVNIVVEGLTEETFVRDILSPFLGARRVFVTARRVETGRAAGKVYRGGLVSYEKACRDILRWLIQDKDAYVTTMFDLYRLPADFPGVSNAPQSEEPYARVARLEQALALRIGSERFIPYLQLHEFEGLLFSDVEAIDAVLGVEHSQLRSLQVIRARFATPELIDDGESTVPSKRLITLFGGYNKPAFGSRIAARIGLPVLRRECPHFNQWISRLEVLAAP